jgi:hypothetical protein
MRFTRIRRRRPAILPRPLEPEQRAAGEEAIRTAELRWAEAFTPGTPRLKTKNL